MLDLLEADFRPSDCLGLLTNSLNACLVTQLFLRLTLRVDKKSLVRPNTWLFISVHFRGCSSVSPDVTVHVELLISNEFLWCCSTSSYVTVLLELLVTEDFWWQSLSSDVVVLKLLSPLSAATESRLGIGREQGGLEFRDKLLWPTETEFEAPQCFTLVWLVWSFIALVNPEFTLEDLLFKLLIGCFLPKQILRFPFPHSLLL